MREQRNASANARIENAESNLIGVSGGVRRRRQFPRYVHFRVPASRGPTYRGPRRLRSRERHALRGMTMTSALDSLPRRRSCYRAVRNWRADNERLASLFRFLRAIPGANTQWQTSSRSFARKRFRTLSSHARENSAVTRLRALRSEIRIIGTRVGAFYSSGSRI